MLTAEDGFDESLKQELIDKLTAVICEIRTNGVKVYEEKIDYEQVEAGRWRPLNYVVHLSVVDPITKEDVTVTISTKVKE